MWRTRPQELGIPLFMGRCQALRAAERGCRGGSFGPKLAPVIRFCFHAKAEAMIGEGRVRWTFDPGSSR
jgi:hypothetical protein